MRILVITSKFYPYAPFLFSALEPFKNSVVGVFIHQSESKSKRLGKVYGKAGWQYTVLKAVLFSVVTLRQKIGSFFPGISGKYNTIESLARKFFIPISRISSLHNPSVQKLLKELKPDIILSLFFEAIYDSETLRIPKYGILNFHPSLLPRYAGVAPTFWVLVNGETETGVTFHWITEQVDSGDILLQSQIPISRHASVHSLYLETCYAGAKLLSEALHKIQNNNWIRQKQDLSVRSYYSFPTQQAYNKLKRNKKVLFHLKDLV
jgi:methionyl-tRNA formyltransferase